MTKFLSVFHYVAENMNWEGLGRGIGEFIGSIDWATHLGTAFDIIWEVLSGLISGLFDTDAGKIAIAIGGGILGIKGLFNVADFALTKAQWATGERINSHFCQKGRKCYLAILETQPD